MRTHFPAMYVDQRPTPETQQLRPNWVSKQLKSTTTTTDDSVFSSHNCNNNNGD